LISLTFWRFFAISDFQSSLSIGLGQLNGAHSRTRPRNERLTVPGTVHVRVSLPLVDGGDAVLLLGLDHLEEQPQSDGRDPATHRLSKLTECNILFSVLAAF
jgi:hypothetical protein